VVVVVVVEVDEVVVVPAAKAAWPEGATKAATIRAVVVIAAAPARCQRHPFLRALDMFSPGW